MSKQNIEFKDSGIPWIGQIPKHWEVIRNKYVFTHKKEIVGSKFKNFDILSLTKNGIKIIVESDQKGKVPDSFETYQIVKKDDIVMCLFDLDVSAVFSGISKYSGIISPAYKIFNPKENLNFKYAGYFFDFVFVNRKFKQYSKNIRFTLGTDEFMNLKIPLPPLNEQKKIAEFLDKKCEIIDKRLSNLERKIKSLKEYKKSLISECVTKGLNPKNMEFKDSGIPWIGQIPKHWEVTKIKYCLKENFGGCWGDDLENEQISQNSRLCIRVADFDFDKQKVKQTADTFRNYTKSQILSTKLQDGDLIIEKSGGGDKMPVGRSVVFEQNLFGEKEVLFANFCQCFRPLNINNKFFAHAMKAFYQNNNMRFFFNQTTGIQNLSIFNILNAFLPYPPLNEQKEIAEFLDKKCEKIDRLNENYTKQITALKEYKKSLIYECVTGKKEI
ncbi:restriction endonuclease subunit S [Campylobacter devanensis]|uniref:restriction endonuclease subunit S n=1 Tax=Campylobacter devanensis TaxID=3161138 RepID=UPI000A343D00|nr:restriction endonuclease subunit S [Campylobacter sp. P0108]